MKNYQVEPGENQLLNVQAPDVTFTGLFVQGKIYDADGAVVVASIPYTHAANGLYLADWKEVLGKGKFVLQNLFYTDSGFTKLANVIHPDADGIEVVHYKYRPSFMGPSDLGGKEKDATDEQLASL